MVELKAEGLRRLLADETVFLRDLIDMDLLVTRHEFQKVGRDAGGIPVGLVWTEYTATAGQDSINIGRGFLEDFTPEELYVIIAHETDHVLQNMKEELGVVRKGAFDTERLSEGDARFWEATQATRFQWDADDYERWLRKMVEGAEAAGTIPHHRAAKELRERPGAFYAVRRRPQGVRVRAYRRQR